MQTDSLNFSKSYKALSKTTKPLAIIYPFGIEILPKVSEIEEFFAPLSKASKDSDLTYLGFTKPSNNYFHQVFVKCLAKNRKGVAKFDFNEFVEGMLNIASKVLVEFHIFYEHFEEFTDLDFEYFEQYLLDCEDLQYLDLILHQKFSKTLKAEEND